MHDMLLVNSSVLPDVYKRVVEAKKLISSGQAKNASDAARMAGISRSAFYKYKDAVFSYNDRVSGRVVTLQAILDDRPGVLSMFITEIYRLGANILTVNQDIPSDDKAAVSVSICTDSVNFDDDVLLSKLRQVDGIISVTQILG